MVDTASRGSFKLDQAKHTKHGGRKQGGSRRRKILNWSYNETQYLVQSWPEEGIQWQLNSDETEPRWKWNI